MLNCLRQTTYCVVSSLCILVVERVLQVKSRVVGKSKHPIDIVISSLQISVLANFLKWGVKKYLLELLGTGVKFFPTSAKFWKVRWRQKNNAKLQRVTIFISAWNRTKAVLTHMRKTRHYECPVEYVWSHHWGRINREIVIDFFRNCNPVPLPVPVPARPFPIKL